MEDNLLLRRTAAGAVVVSGVLHLAMLGHGGALLRVGTAAMAVLCLPCAGRLWRSDSRRAWVLLAAMGTCMLAAHGWLMSRAPLVSAPVREPGSEAVAHAHGGGPDLLVDLHEPLMLIATCTAGLEVVLAGAALLMTQRGRRSAGAPSVHERRRCLHGQTTSVSDR
ncbi:hypothetical protein A6A08_06065 [Nocardiopsis sp. TSRI0078]|nr:hypothetical protein A6A08_06065 [Nocardiopsis sp. TSRI0078]